MKGFVALFFVFVLFVFPSQGQEKAVTIVVLGSSTAAGAGVKDKNNAWVNRYRLWLQQVNPKNKVVNLAVGGYKTYQIMPTGFTPSWGEVDTLRNITKALTYNPDAIIINLPSNDVKAGISVTEQLSNYATIFKVADDNKIPVWVSTTQPRWVSKTTTKNLMDMRDSTFCFWGDMAIDFWSDIAMESGKINPDYDCGDYTHLNDDGHKILFNRVVDAGILEFISGAYLQAENYNDANNVEIENKYSRNSEDGFVRVKNNTDASVTFKLNAESTTSLNLAFRHSNQTKTVSGELYINGVGSADELDFFPTKSDKVWDKIYCEVELEKGENTIELNFSGQEKDISFDFISWDNSLVSPLSSSNNILNETNEKIKVFPVPFTSKLTLKNVPESSTMSLYSVSGVKIMEKQDVGNHISFNTSGFKAGIYFMHITNGKELSVFKVIKK